MVNDGGSDGPLKSAMKICGQEQTERGCLTESDRGRNESGHVLRKPVTT